jgi:hypothetical protein
MAFKSLSTRSPQRHGGAIRPQSPKTPSSPDSRTCRPWNPDGLHFGRLFSQARSTTGNDAGRSKIHGASEGHSIFNSSRHAGAAGESTWTRRAAKTAHKPAPRACAHAPGSGWTAVSSWRRSPGLQSPPVCARQARNDCHAQQGCQFANGV